MAKKFFDTPTISEQKKYFKWYSNLPLIFAIAIIAVSCIIGIVLSKGFWALLISLLIGGVLAMLEYFVYKIMLSQQILTVLYLQNLCETNRIKENGHISEQSDSNNKIQNELKLLKRLYEAGSISKQEYETKKKELLEL